ncbi:hypothetical protein SAMD00019534_056600 [Acytostelium subglobosum LB1]|uniref:hypothetical protein n=1 Tax=Acytostelium subglobosum LB1 TaxID=1410327 RepID=UPI000645073F|nr:hypothetical protein SAMD00019534_056600 [Acytostelium subglobosum LB1]GAM22485.1 hypothetical protein SAMD00019534_056600 [Acytostelium subglobosum LB1]|eukprot:XP_012754605.1 hypothetical protein SAMD00019534_056600 [Acytostelium subglobosum LB1]
MNDIDKKRTLEEASSVGDEQPDEPKVTSEEEEQATKKTKTETETATETTAPVATESSSTTSTSTKTETSGESKPTTTTEEAKSNGDKAEDKATPWTFKAFQSNPDPSKPFTSPFSFSSFASTPGASPFSFNLNTTTSFTNGFSKATTESDGNNKEASSESTDGAIADGEDYSKSATYVPILQSLQPIQTLTGEEDEKTLCSAKGKLYIFNESYKERGVGMLKLNRNTTTGNSRLLLNIDGSKRSALNVAIFATMTIDTPTEKSLRFTAFEDGKFHSFLVNMKKPDEITLFETNIKKQIAILKEKQPVPAATVPAAETTTEASNTTEAAVPATTTTATSNESTPKKEEKETKAE